jgi:hypothetical protein
MVEDDRLALIRRSSKKMDERAKCLDDSEGGRRDSQKFKFNDVRGSVPKYDDEEEYQQ